ncbi:MAG: hypothetical protein ACFFD4_03755 [Candidatus Odinarchaeota archaeon]
MLTNIVAIIAMDGTGKIVYQRIYDDTSLSVETYFTGIIQAFDSFASSLAQDTARSIDVGDKCISIKTCNYNNESNIFVIIWNKTGKDNEQNYEFRLDLIINQCLLEGIPPKNTSIDEIVYKNDKEIERMHRRLVEISQDSEANRTVQLSIQQKILQLETKKGVNIDAFFIITSSGLCLFQHTFDVTFSIDETILSAFVTAFRTMIREMAQEEIRSLSLETREFLFRVMKLKKEVIFFVLAVHADSDVKQEQNYRLWLEFATYVFQDKFKDQLKKLDKHQVIDTREYETFGKELLEIIKSKPTRLADVIKTDEEHVVFLQNLLDELSRHVPINFLQVDNSFIKVSGRKLLVPSDISREEMTEVSKKIEKVVSTSFGKKIYDMAVKKVMAD